MSVIIDKGNVLHGIIKSWGFRNTRKMIETIETLGQCVKYVQS